MTIDTNIIIAYLSGEEKVVEFLNSWRNRGGFLYLATIVEAEILSYGGWSSREETIVGNFLCENFISIPFDRKVAKLTAKLRRNRRIKLPDAAIAATAIHTGTPLVTRNFKDFKSIDDLDLVTI